MDVLETFIKENKIRELRLALLRDRDLLEKDIPQPHNPARSKSKLIAIACQYNNEEAVELLCWLGCDVTSDDNEAVVQAARKGNLRLVKFLEERGADLRAQFDKVFTNAVVSENEELIKYLHEKGAPVSADNYFSLKYLHKFKKEGLQKLLLGFLSMRELMKLEKSSLEFPNSVELPVKAIRAEIRLRKERISEGIRSSTPVLS